MCEARAVSTTWEIPEDETQNPVRVSGQSSLSCQCESAASDLASKSCRRCLHIKKLRGIYLPHAPTTLREGPCIGGRVAVRRARCSRQALVCSGGSQRPPQALRMPRSFAMSSTTRNPDKEWLWRHGATTRISRAAFTALSYLLYAARIVRAPRTQRLREDGD